MRLSAPAMNPPMKPAIPPTPPMIARVSRIDGSTNMTTAYNQPSRLVHIVGRDHAEMTFSSTTSSM